MDLPPSFLLRIVYATQQSNPGQGAVYVIVRRPYAFLAEGLQRALGEGREDIKVFVDRRHGERRRGARPVTVDRRRNDRRLAKEELCEIVTVPATPARPDRMP